MERRSGKSRIADSRKPSTSAATNPPGNGSRYAKGRALCFEEVTHDQKIMNSRFETDHVMRSIMMALTARWAHSHRTVPP